MRGIVIENLSLTRRVALNQAHYHGAADVVRELHLEVHPGEVLGLVGESGSGKSLTCQAIMDMLPPGIVRTAGSIRLDGVDVRDADRDFRGRKVAMILQNPSSCFDPIRTVAAQFADTLISHHLSCSRQIMEDYLREAGFRDAQRVPDLYPYEMSGGMLQRVMIAMALALHAPYLLADEPTTDLDPVAQQRVLGLLRDMCTRHGVGILLVSHDFSVMEAVAHHVAVMRQGCLVEQGPTTELLRAPGMPYTQELTAAYAMLRAAWHNEAETAEATKDAESGGDEHAHA